MTCICERSCGESRTDSNCKECADNRKKYMNNPTTTPTYDDLRQTLSESIIVLGKCRDKFRHYENQHRQKMIDPNISQIKLNETFEKATANKEMVTIITEFLNQVNKFYE